LTEDVFARQNRLNRDKAEHSNRETEAKNASKEIQARVKAAEARREAMAKPDPAYRPRLPMRFDV
jgi:hypothetical protein